MAKLLPKNPWAAAGVGVLVGAGIAGYKVWNRRRAGEDVTRKTAVVEVVRSGLLFGGVAAASTLAGGQGGGGVGLAAMSLVGLGGAGGGGGNLPALLSQVLGGGGGGGGGGRGSGRGGQGQGGQGQGGQGQGGGGRSSSLLDSVAETVGNLFSGETQTIEAVPAETEAKPKRGARSAKAIAAETKTAPDEA